MRHLARWLCPVALLAGALPTAAWAEAPIQNGGNLGLGLGGGTGVTGFSAKYFIGADFSLQAVVGPWNSFGLDPFSTGLGASSGQFGFSLDALLESRVWVDGSAADLAWNGGAGVAWVPGGFDVLGLAIVGGFEINMEFIPVDLVLEYRPHIWLAPWPGDFSAVNTYIDFVGFSAHLRVYPFPAGKRD